MLTKRDKVCLNVLMGILMLGCFSATHVYGFAGGTGEPNNPYQIATAEDLISIGSDRDLLDKNFVLIEDIDLDPNLPGGRVFTDALIAQDDSDGVGGHGGSPFKGVFDGQGHTIANLYIEGKYGYDAGLFGKLSGLVKDLHLTEVVVSGSPCGAIAGLNHNGLILRCSVTGQVSGSEDIGGLAGSNWDGSLVECQAQVQVTGEDNVGGMVGKIVGGGILMRCEALADISGQQNIGGLVGDGGHGGKIIECRTTATVIGSNNVGGLIGDCGGTVIWWSSANCEVIAEETAGGLAGRVTRDSGPVIMNCYVHGSIAGSIVGGLAGEARHIQIINCYAACEILPLETEGTIPVIGGLFGDTIIPDWAPRTAACFWDAELSGITVGTGSNPLELGTGLTTEQMRDEDAFRNAGWDFSHTWTLDDYLILQWESQEEPIQKIEDEQKALF